MTTTRRELVKLASALGMADALPPINERIAAAEILDEPISDRTSLDPGEFVEELYGSIGNSPDQFSNDWAGSLCPDLHAEYAQARQRLNEVHADHRIGFHEVGDWDSATFNLIMGVYYSGVRHGAAYEHLRRTVVGETVQCTDCWGVGLDDDTDATCTSCGGTGTVALKDGGR